VIQRDGDGDDGKKEREANFFGPRKMDNPGPAIEAEGKRQWAGGSPQRAPRITQLRVRKAAHRCSGRPGASGRCHGGRDRGRSLRANHGGHWLRDVSMTTRLGRWSGAASVDELQGR